MDNRLRVALSTVDMAPFLKQRVQFAMVVDFAVERDPYGPVFIRHGLMAAREVYDRKTPMTKTDRVAGPCAGIIRTSMRQGITHRDQPRSVNTPVQSYGVSNTANSTHELTLL